MPSMEAIRCEGLTKHFGRFAALSDLDITVEQGTTYGFLGPNGAGKTTTLRLLTGITTPSNGRMWVANEEVSGDSLHLKSLVGYLPESPSFYGWMTGREFLMFVGDLYEMEPSEARQRADEMLGRVNLDDAADRKVKGYSRGMQQRLGLAQSLMHDPEVLFLDEPASALDPMGRRDMLETIRSLKGHTTIFLSTHILADVERICDRVAIINRGKLVTTGAISDLQAQKSGTSFELEFEEDPAPMAQTLAGVPWVSGMRSEEHGAHYVFIVEVNDVELAKKELPKLTYESGLTLIRYELAVPSLEDVFMDLVESRERTS